MKQQNKSLPFISDNLPKTIQHSRVVILSGHGRLALDLSKLKYYYTHALSLSYGGAVWVWVRG